MLLTQEFAKLRRKEFSKVKFQVSNKERVTEEKKKAEEFGFYFWPCCK